MSNKRQVYSGKKHLLHLNRKKGERLEYLYHLLEIEYLMRGPVPRSKVDALKVADDGVVFNENEIKEESNNEIN